MIRALFLILLASPAYAATTVVTGSPSIEDTYMTDGVISDRNYGGAGNVDFGATAGGAIGRALFRISAASIPNETFTGITFRLRRFADGANSTAGDTANFAFVKNANTWTEGVGVGGVGEASWDDYSTGNAWTGSGGCSSASGDELGGGAGDYDSSPVQMAYGAHASGGTIDFDFDVLSKAQAFYDTRDAARTANGFVVFTSSPVNGSFVRSWSNEHGSDAPSVIFEYADPGSILLMMLE